MSYIDCFDHEYIGNIGYLPIYHPLQMIKGEGWGAPDFSASEKNLILGGGSGEHPALVFHHLECLAAMFLHDQIDDAQEESISKKHDEYLTDLLFRPSEEIMEFCGWSIYHYSEIAQMAKSNVFGSSCCDDDNVEEWICKSIGELVYFSLPELNPEHERLNDIFGQFEIVPTMRCVTCTPPGYPDLGGRIKKDNNIRWGVQRWRYSLRDD